jgi:uncharacterized protein
MEGLELLDTLQKINPWFKTGSVSPGLLEEFKRREFEQLKNELETTETATLVIGGRRVGKSVLMYQLIDSLLREKGVNQRNVLFVQGDNPILTEVLRAKNYLETVLNIYQKYILAQKFEEITEVIYVFIDEAQSIPNWETSIKSLIDLKYKVKFIVTGSSSRQLRQGAQNPLTGRVTINTIYPFSFYDFTKFSIADNDKQRHFAENITTLSKSFRESLLNGDVDGTFNVLNSVGPIVEEYNIKSQFETYLTIGGFPWVISHQETKDDIPKYLRDLLTTTISKDILTQVEIRETQAFERLMVNLALSSGQIMSYKSLAERLGIDERILIKYIDYYVDSHWAFISSPFQFHRKQDSVKTGKKAYVIDSGVMNTLTFKDRSDISSDRQYRGQLLENVLHNHLIDFKQNITGLFQNFIPYWQTSDGREIDFIFEVKSSMVIPIEAKCKHEVPDEDLVAIKTFVADKQSAPFGIVTSENAIKLEDNIITTPYTNLAILL